MGVLSEFHSYLFLCHVDFFMSWHDIYEEKDRDSSTGFDLDETHLHSYQQNF